jgi:hypothetical protein
LRWIHEGGVYDGAGVTIKQTRPLSLLHPESRTSFIKTFVWLVKFVADGYGDVGNLRRANPKIHRDATTEEKITGPPQSELEQDQLDRWRDNAHHEYAP